MRAMPYIGFLLRVVRRFATSFAVLALALSLVFSGALLALPSDFTAPSSVLPLAGLTTVPVREAGGGLVKRIATGKIVRETHAGLRRHASKRAAHDIASIGGVALIAPALACEVKDACGTALDMEGPEAVPAAETDPDMARRFAKSKPDRKSPGSNNSPNAQEIGSTMRAAPPYAWGAAGEQLDRLRVIYVPLVRSSRARASDRDSELSDYGDLQDRRFEVEAVKS